MWNKTEWMVFFVSLFVFALFTKTGVASANDSSRMAEIQSIVEKGTFAIDESQFSDTIDKVFINGHFYSEKPALSYLIGVPVYFVLYKAGINFSDSPKLSYYLITLFTVGLLVSIMLVYFYKLLGRYELDEHARIMYVVLLCITTLLLPYSVIFNNHGMTASLLFLSFYFVLSVRKPLHLFLTGLLAGLTAAIDLVTGSIFFVLFAIFLFPRVKRKVVVFAAGAAVPVLFYLLVNFLISGSILPFYIVPEYWQYEGSSFGTADLAGIAKPFSGRYALELLFGQKAGFISYTPLLFFSLLGMGVALYKKKYRKEVLMVLAGLVFVLLYLVTRTNNYGGCAYGFRYGIPFIPLMFLFTPLVFRIKNKKIASGLMVLFVIAAFLSIIHAFTGTMNPWTCDVTTLIPRIPFKFGFA